MILFINSGKKKPRNRKQTAKPISIDMFYNYEHVPYRNFIYYTCCNNFSLEY